MLFTHLLGVLLAIHLPGGMDALGKRDPSTDATIEILRKAQDANEGRYPAGRLRVMMRKGQRDKQKATNERHELIEARVQWSGDEIRTDLTRRGPNGSPPDLAAPINDREVCILNRKSSTSTNYGPRVIIESVAGKEISPEYRLSPKISWYTSQIHPDYPCIKAFLPATDARPSRTDTGVVIDSEKLDPTRVRLTLRRPEANSSLAATYSYEFDGNVADFTLDSRNTGLMIEAKYQWKRDARGRVYLAQLDRVAYTTVDQSTIEVYDSYEITEFDPDYVPGRDVFELHALKLKDGTIVQDQVSGSNYRLGDRAVHTVSESFDDLITQMKSRGFSSPGRR